MRLPNGMPSVEVRWLPTLRASEFLVPGKELGGPSKARILCGAIALGIHTSRFWDRARARLGLE